MEQRKSPSVYEGKEKPKSTKDPKKNPCLDIGDRENKNIKTLKWPTRV